MSHAKQFQLPLGGKMFPLSLDNAHLIIVRAIEHGDVFLAGARFTVCTTVDVARIIKAGTISDPKHFDDEKWLFEFVGVHEARVLKITLLLDLAEDLDCPVIYYLDIQSGRVQ